jgi:uncharacterized protein
MSSERLPTFRYHPDPISTGSVIPSKKTCVVCERVRGFIYCGPVYAAGDYDESICPWCIADGSAHEKLNATFQDDGLVPDPGFPDAPQVDASIIGEVCQRTPGYRGWQQEVWFTCCGDAAAFLGRAGRDELETKWPAAKERLRESMALSDEAWMAFFNNLDAKGSPSAYVFRCLHCGELGVHWDCD